MSDFGFMAHHVRVKVTNEPRQAGTFLKIPGQVGFQQKDKKYVNEWFDVMVPPDLEIEKPEKGDFLYVTGKVGCSEWQGKKQWVIWANEIEGKEKEERPPVTPADEDVPF